MTVLLPFLFLFLSFLQFLQVLLGEFDDVRSLLLRGQRRGGESAGSSVERLAIGGTRQILPQMLVNRFTLQEFGSEGEIQGQKQEEDINEPDFCLFESKNTFNQRLEYDASCAERPNVFEIVLCFSCLSST